MTWQRRGMTEPMLLSALEVAQILGLEHPPTPEQVAIIESPRSPALVVAGAGSGKTETMAARVVWLVANGYVAPHEVLGLTFTRKAAGQLATRIRDRIAMLAAQGFAPGDVDDDLNIATVSTYNAFANRIYGQYAIHIGLDPDATVIGDAAAWQLARDVARTSLDGDVGALDKKLNDITGGLLDMSRALNDNVADPSMVQAWGESMQEKLHELADSYSAARAEPKNTFDASVAYAQSLPVLVRLANEYDRVKRARGLIEFSDQVRYALEICETTPSVVRDVRDQFKIVLLDEYQDTSVVQTRLLTTIFRGSPVMAVGDPHQSIYGWRGASATNMASFSDDFGVPAGTEPFALSISWRNPRNVLDAANLFVAPLSSASPIPVTSLRARDNAPTGPIDLSYTETMSDETDAVAQWFFQRLGTGGSEFTAALLFRASRNMTAFRDALENLGVPCHVVGLGGLLDEPVIVDLICALRVIHDATADSELVRLLSGPRWMIAPRDLVGLRRVSHWLSQHDHKRQLLDPDVRDALRSSVTSEDSESLIDALDFIATVPTKYEVFDNISEEGLNRLREAGAFVNRLRQYAAFDLRDLVTYVYEEMLLDIETAANPHSSGARGAFDAFLEPLATFASTTDRPTLGSFLGWLREAERREKLSPIPPRIEKGVVQLMTIHAAKGLEWDYVAVPRLVANELPGDRSRADTWRKFGSLPYPFRGDVSDLPEWAWKSATTVEELHASWVSFREEVRLRFDAEERRLVYVAVTRTERDLLLSGSYWSTQKSPRQPSVFLRELIDSNIVEDAIPPMESEEVNPLGDSILRVPWPSDPLGVRRIRVLAAADAVASAETDQSSSWDHDIDLLLRERAEGLRAVRIPAPRRIAASKFKDFISTPADVAAGLVRPMPEQPYRATLLGTVFHEWVERRAGLSHLTPGDLLAALENEDDVERARTGPVDEKKLRQLQETFIASEWGQLKPIDVEREIHIVLAGVTVVCKIDAVFEREGADGAVRYEIVDWKTGHPPQDDDDYELKQTQLALYRLAYSRWAQIDPDSVDAAFYFVAEDVVLRPQHLMTESDLIARWKAATN